MRIPINKKILIVEDDKDLLSILKIQFVGGGFSVVIAQDGEEGAAVAEKEKPDLIITDVLMPKMGGIEMAKKIKEFDQNVPVMFLTNVKDGLAENAPDYLIKSDLQIEEVIAKVRARLGL